jgi:hypothetical protein
MRRTRWFWICLVCAGLSACAEQSLDCGAESVKLTLTSIVREQFLRVAFDTVAYTYDADQKAAFKKATRVTAEDPRLLEWDKSTGRLTCTARVIIDAPESADRPNAKTATLLQYRVTGGDDGAFFVEVAFGDLAAIRVPPAAKSSS